MNDITNENMTHDVFDEWLKKNRWLLKDIKVTNDRLIHKQFKSVHYSDIELKEKDSNPFYVPIKSEISDYQQLLIGTPSPLFTELNDFMFDVINEYETAYATDLFDWFNLIQS